MLRDGLPYSSDPKKAAAHARRLELMEQCYRLHLEGHGCRTIAELLQIGVTTALKYTREAKKQVARNWANSLETALSEELEKLRTIEQESWRAWRKSQRVLKKVVSEKRTGGEDGPTTMRRVEKSESIGDVNYLKAAIDCVKSRSAILAKLVELDRENGSGDDLLIQPVEVVVTSREEALAMLEFQEFRRRVVDQKTVDGQSRKVEG